MSQPIFRERAIKAYQDPDRRGSLLRVAPPSLTRLPIAFALLTLLALVVSAVTRVPVTTSGRGVVRPLGGVVVVRATSADTVRSLSVSAGSTVHVGETLLTLEHEGILRATTDGIVDVLSVRPGEAVSAGAMLVKVVPTGARLVGFVALPARDRSRLRSGLPVRLSYDEYPVVEHGAGRGHIERVSEDLVSVEFADRYLHDYDARVPGFFVQIALDAPPPGAAGPLHNGMLFEATVPLREQRLLTLLFKPLARVLGE